MRMNEIQKSFMLGVFAPKIKVVCKYAKERRVSCQENSLRLIGSHFLSSKKISNCIYVFASVRELK